MLLNGSVLLTCFHHSHSLLHSTHTDKAFRTFELDGENPPAVLSEVKTCRCAALNQCDTNSCSDGISMIMYQVDYNKL